MISGGLPMYGKSDDSVVISRRNFHMTTAAMEPKVAETMEKSIEKLSRTVDAALTQLAAS